jgi:deoxyribodipyrimidine photo-lyase
MTLKKGGTPYTRFTPYFQNTSKLPVPPVTPNPYKNYFNKPLPLAQKAGFLDKTMPGKQLNTTLQGGRRAALDLLSLLHKHEGYDHFRDFPEKNATTHLSPYLKFTVCSPREVYNALCSQLGTQHALIRSLYWRDFFTMIAYFFPYVFSGSFYPKFDKLAWSDDMTAFEKWCKGCTGFPIVDAGIRELNATGFMHNRVRMITASFLIKDLHINWRWGEKYFAQQLVDYDPAVNNGNWQWVASTGCDVQPYFRIFNPWSQQKKFDPECVYIKRWVPELKNLEPKLIHQWHDDRTRPFKHAYFAPMLDHSIKTKETLKAYQKV